MNGVQLGIVRQEVDVIAVDGHTAVLAGDEIDVVAAERLGQLVLVLPRTSARTCIDRKDRVVLREVHQTVVV